MVAASGPSNNPNASSLAPSSASALKATAISPPAGAPLELVSFEADSVVRTDRPAHVRWRVRNVSDKPVGDRVGCPVSTKLSINAGTVQPNQVLIATALDVPPEPLTNALHHNIAQLAPGDVMDFEGWVSFADDVPLYERTRLRIETALQDTKPPGTSMLSMREKPDAPSHVRYVTLQRAAPYQRDSDAGFLLVTNEATSRGEVAAWQKLANELGTHVSLWDVAVHGDISLAHDVDGHSPHRDFANKTIILLNNHFTHAGHDDVESAHLGAHALWNEIPTQHSSVYCVGEAMNLAEELTDVAPNKTQTFASKDDFYAAVAAGNAATSTAPYGQDVVQLSLEETQALQTYLRGLYPERVYVMQYSGDTVLVSRGIDRNARSVAQLPQADVHSPAFVDSATNRYGLCKSLPFAQKLQACLYAWAMQNGPMGEPLAAAILSDLAEEQLVLRAGEWRAGLSPDTIREHLLPMLTQLAAAAPLLRARPTYMINLIARFQAALLAQRRTVDRVPFRRARDVDIVTNGLLHDLRVGLFDHLRTASGGRARQEISAAVRLSTQAGCTLERLWQPDDTSAVQVGERVYGPPIRPIPALANTPWYPANNFVGNDSNNIGSSSSSSSSYDRPIHAPFPVIYGGFGGSIGVVSAGHGHCGHGACGHCGGHAGG